MKIRTFTCYISNNISPFRDLKLTNGPLLAANDFSAGQENSLPSEKPGMYLINLFTDVSS